MITGASPTMDDGKIKIIISYEDENGAVTEVEKEMSLLVTEPVEETADMGTMDGMDEMMMEEEPSLFDKFKIPALAVLALAGAGTGAGVYRHRKKKKALKEEEEDIDDEIS